MFFKYYGELNSKLNKFTHIDTLGNDNILKYNLAILCGLDVGIYELTMSSYVRDYTYHLPILNDNAKKLSLLSSDYNHAKGVNNIDNIDTRCLYEFPNTKFEHVVKYKLNNAYHNHNGSVVKFLRLVDNGRCVECGWDGKPNKIKLSLYRINEKNFVKSSTPTVYNYAKPKPKAKPQIIAEEKRKSNLNQQLEIGDVIIVAIAKNLTYGIISSFTPQSLVMKDFITQKNKTVMIDNKTKTFKCYKLFTHEDVENKTEEYQNFEDTLLLNKLAS